MMIRLLAAGFAVAALYHVAALVIPAFARLAYPPGYPGLRHIVFVAIDAALASLFLSRPRWLIWPYTILTVQVLQGHGVRLWQTWEQARGIQWIDAITVCGTLLGLALLVADRRD